jgi:hypothetical protein
VTRDEYLQLIRIEHWRADISWRPERGAARSSLRVRYARSAIGRALQDDLRREVGAARCLAAGEAGVSEGTSADARPESSPFAGELSIVWRHLSGAEALAWFGGATLEAIGAARSRPVGRERVRQIVREQVAQAMRAALRSLSPHDEEYGEISKALRAWLAQCPRASDRPQEPAP